MFLEKMELFGFKSFPDRIKVKFTPGMTCIVGPNGCGKSNITDALRWVFGEQSARKLRGGRMQDVIFSGTSDRKPLNMAEVRIVLDNSRHTLPSEYNEVSVSRKLFSDGDSEYYINKQKVRLKDVQQLITDTGIGMSAYSFIEQGMISQILSTKAEERRAIFEEAAGIMKYRVRKKETARKLEGTSENLNRLKDIFFEVERQLKTLSRQVDKARIYEGLFAELTDIEVMFYKVIYDKGKRENDILSESIELIKRDNSEILVATNRLNAALEDYQLKLMAVEDEKGRMESEYYSKKMSLEKIRNDIESLDKENLFLDADTMRLKDENAEMAAKNEERRMDCGMWNKELKKLGMKLSGLEDVISGLETDDEKMMGELSENEERYQKMVSGLLENMRDQSSARSKLESFSTDIKTKSERIERLSQKNVELEGKTAAFRQEFEGICSEIRNNEDSLSVSTADEEKLKTEILLLDQSISALEDTLFKKRSSLNAIKAKLEGLEFLDRKLEGFGNGAKAILERPDRFSLTGILASSIQVEKGYERVVENVLSDHMQAFIGDIRTFDNIRSYLKERKRGEGFHYLADDHVEPEVRKGSLYEKCRCEDRAADRLLRHLLGTVMPVSEYDASLLDSGATLVMDDGTIITPQGLMSFTDLENQGPGMLGRKKLKAEYTREIEKLDRIIEKTQSEIDDGGKRKALCDDKMAQIKSLNERLRSEMYSLSSKSDYLNKEISRLDDELRANNSEMSLLRAEIADLAKDKKEIDIEISLLNVKNETEENDKISLQEKIGTLRQEREKMRREISARREEYAELASDIRAKSNDVLRSGDAVKASEYKINENERKITSNEEKKQNNKNKAEEYLSRTDSTIKEVEAFEVQIKEKRESSAAIKEMIAEKNSELREFDSRYRVIQDELREKEIENVKQTDKLENIRLQIKEKYEKDIESVSMEIPDDYAEDEMRVRVEELQGKLKSLGNVNMSALEEYNELKERYDFLTAQKKDLEAAKGQLEEAMDKIDAVSKEKFLDTFYRIRENFKTIFPMLFNGGKADISLVMDENGDEDVLGCGIDVNVKPPGKRLQNIDLLSGGEKALSAIALLFSIFKVKPAPFCVLDEIDAPLDDANIARFINMLSEFTATTQFIIVSHNKYTMEMADALYGVTMDEPGVSKIVSVDFKGE